MRVIECSMCRRRAAWLIERELFCEGHKEVIVQEACIDRFSFDGSQMRSVLSAAEAAIRSPQPERKEPSKAMAEAIPTHPEPLILSIPLKLAVDGENCDTLSDLRPQGCGVCDSDAVLRVEPILSRGPDSPAHAAHGPKLSLIRALHA